MIARMSSRKLALLSAAATVLAACGVDRAADVEVQGLTVEEPGTAPSAADNDEGTRDTAATNDETTDGSPNKDDRLSLSELREDGIPWHLLPDADRPTRGSTEQADCQGSPLELVAC